MLFAVAVENKDVDQTILHSIGFVDSTRVACITSVWYEYFKHVVNGGNTIFIYWGIQKIRATKFTIQKAAFYYCNTHYYYTGVLKAESSGRATTTLLFKNKNENNKKKKKFSL